MSFYYVQELQVKLHPIATCSFFLSSQSTIHHPFSTSAMVKAYVCKVIPGADTRKPSQGLSVMSFSKEFGIVNRDWILRGVLGSDSLSPCTNNDSAAKEGIVCNKILSPAAKEVIKQHTEKKNANAPSIPGPPYLPPSINPDDYAQVCPYHIS
jgi:hypothetical protein